MKTTKKTIAMLLVVILTAWAFPVFSDGASLSSAPAGPPNPPTHIAATWGQSDTSIGFAWYSDSAASANVAPLQSVVQVAKKSDMAGGVFPESSAAVYAGAPAGAAAGKYSNKVSVSGLDASTEYVYRVGNGTPANWSSAGTFTTGSAAGFSFIYASDAQPGSQSGGNTWEANLGKAVAKAGSPAFMAHAGDQVDSATSEQGYSYFFTPQAEFLNMPIMPAIGNHDNGGRNTNYTWHFNEPGNGANGSKSYWFMYGNALFLVLDTETPGHACSDQIDWMRQVATSNPHRWLIVIMHRCLYSVGDHAKDSDVAPRRSALDPVFGELGVDLALQGHDHSYMRSFIMKNGARQTETIDDAGYSVNPSGTLFMTLGSLGGQKQYSAGNYSYANVYKSGVPQYAVIDVAANTLEIRVYDAGSDSQPFDFYNIRKITRPLFLTKNLKNAKSYCFRAWQRDIIDYAGH
ncbi:MAG: metallophosphoesterase family protein [Clostridiales bacterium]|nr:metallophosphoesterase family protein [Clostridiales bacterium]